MVIEGGPGTAHEAQVVSETKSAIIPIGRSGGCASDLYDAAVLPEWAHGNDWAELGKELTEARRVAQAVVRLIRRDVASRFMKIVELYKGGVVGGASATTEMLYRLPQRGINDFLQELRSEDAAMVRDVFTNDLEYGSVNSFCAMPDTIPELPKLEQLLRWIRS